MKKFFILIVLCTLGLCCFAQDSTSTDNHIIYLDIPNKMNIKDKIFLKNNTPYTIIQAAVVLAGDGTTLGTATYVGPNCIFEMASYRDNYLKKIRGAKIAIKVKGVKKVIGDVSSTNVGGGSFATGGFGVGVNHKEIKAEELNNIDPSLITYDFNITLSEADHDLYLNVAGGSAKSALDF